MKRHALDLRDQGGVLVRGRLTKDGVKWATMLPQFYGDFTGRVVGVVDRDFDTAEGLKTDEPRPRATLITLGAHEVENYILNAAAIAEAAARQRRDRGANAEATLTEEQVEEALEQALQGRVKETRNWLRPKYRHQLGGDAWQRRRQMTGGRSARLTETGCCATCLARRSGKAYAGGSATGA
ncbi:MAG: hypothetical protein ACE5R4_13440, partial [Armatimonadota bacterium]